MQTSEYKARERKRADSGEQISPMYRQIAGIQGTPTHGSEMDSD